MHSIIHAMTAYPKLIPLSYSKVKTLLECPLKYKHQYLDKHEKGDPVDKTSAMVGKFVHKVLEDCMVKCQSFGFEDGKVDYDLTWMGVKESNMLTHSDYEVAMKHKDTARRVFRRLRKFIVANDMKIQPEAVFCMNRAGSVSGLGAWPTRFFYGYIDLFMFTPDYRAVLLDYKTHSKSTENAALVGNQTKIYTYFMFKKFPQLRAITPGAAYIPDELLDLEDPILASDLPKLESEVMGYLNSALEVVQAGDYSPKICELCKWCDYISWCPAQQEKEKKASAKKEKAAEKKASKAKK